MTFASRDEAAERIAERVRGATPELSRVTVVVGVGDEGATVAAAVGRMLGVPVGAYAVAELLLPWRPSLPFGALTDDNHHYLDADVVADHTLGAREQGQLARALLPSLRARRPERPAIAGQHVLLVTAALVTGYRTLAVAAALRAGSAASIVVATAGAARDAAARVAAAGHVVIALTVRDGPNFDGQSLFAR